MGELDEVAVQRLVLALAKRNEVRRPNHTTGKMSNTYTKAVLSTLKWFLTWCSESEQVSWPMPRRTSSG